jgi:hypothetical protein
MKMQPLGYPEMFVRNYHYLLRNNPEERSSPVATSSVQLGVV